MNTNTYSSRYSFFLTVSLLFLKIAQFSYQTVNLKAIAFVLKTAWFDKERERQRALLVSVTAEALVAVGHGCTRFIPTPGAATVLHHSTESNKPRYVPAPR